MTCAASLVMMLTWLANAWSHARKSEPGSEGLQGAIVGDESNQAFNLAEFLAEPTRDISTAATVEQEMPNEVTHYV